MMASNEESLLCDERAVNYQKLNVAMKSEVLATK